MRDKFQKIFSKMDMAPSTANTAAGFSASAFCALILYPLDYFQTRMAADVFGPTRTRQFLSYSDLYQRTVTTDGIKGLFRGYLMSIGSVTLNRGLTLSAYHNLKPVVNRKEDSIMSSFILGWGVSSLSGIITYPLQVARKRYMISTLMENNPPYPGALKCLSTVWRTEGLRGIYRGVWLSLADSIGTASLIVISELLKNSAL